MKIRFAIAWNDDKNILDAYAHEMELLEDELDWVFFIDRDAMFMHPFFGLNIRRTIMANERFWFYTCYTNRVQPNYQIFPNVEQANNDMEYHHHVGALAWETHGTRVLDITNKARSSALSGVVMGIQKRAWNVIFSKMKSKPGMLGIDNEFHRQCTAAGLKTGLMMGTYAFHWYRNNNKLGHKHLK